MGEYRKLQPKKFEPRSIRETAEGRYWRAYKSPALLDQISQVTSVAFADVYPYALAVTSSARVTVYNSQNRRALRTFARFKDVAYGGNCEAQIKHSDDPSNPNSSTVGMSFMNWRGDVALGGNAMSSVTLGKDTQLTARANLNSRGAGQLTLRATTNERLQLAGLGLVPLLCALIGRVRGD